MTKQEYDPDKISELRKEMDSPKQTNTIKILYDAYVVAKGMKASDLTKLLEKELIDGYNDDEAVPLYRKFYLGGKELEFRESLGKYKPVYKTKIFRHDGGLTSISQIVDLIYHGIESQREWLDFKTILVTNSIKKKASELEHEGKREVMKIDLSGLRNED